jgi:hypothetical protein
VKRRLGWRQVSRSELAEHLKSVQVTASEAVGEASLYRCQNAQGDSIAIALPGDSGLIISVRLEIPPVLERRRKAGDNAPLDE